MSSTTLRRSRYTTDCARDMVVASPSNQLPVLVPTPIPAAWVVSGAPEARAIELTPGGLGRPSSGLWACSAGEFDWTFGSDEIVRILAGEVRLRFEFHEQIAKVGDVVAFAAGTTVRWVVPEYVEKFWVLGPPPSMLTRLRRKLF